MPTLKAYITFASQVKKLVKTKIVLELKVHFPTPKVALTNILSRFYLVRPIVIVDLLYRETNTKVSKENWEHLTCWSRTTYVMFAEWYIKFTCTFNKVKTNDKRLLELISWSDGKRRDMRKFTFCLLLARQNQFFRV